MSAIVAVIAVALMQVAPKPTLAILPPRLSNEVARVSEPTWVEPQAPSAVAEALEGQARRKYVLIPSAEVKTAAIAVGLGRVEAYGDADKLNALRIRLGADRVIAPIVAFSDWYDRPSSRTVFVDKDDLDREVDYARRNGSIFGPVPSNPRIVETRERGYSTSLFGYLRTGSGVRKTKTVVSEIADCERRPRTERASALDASRRLLTETEASFRSAEPKR